MICMYGLSETQPTCLTFCPIEWFPDRSVVRALHPVHPPLAIPVPPVLLGFPHRLLPTDLQAVTFGTFLSLQVLHVHLLGPNLRELKRL